MWIVAAFAATLFAGENANLEKSFKFPEDKYRAYTLWWLNGNADAETVKEHLKKIKKDGFGGVAPLSFHYRKPATSPAYLTPEWFAMYSNIVETCRELNMQMMFYDDCDFPSGRAGGLMKEKFPEDLLKYLWQGKALVKNGEASILAPEGVLEYACAYNPKSKTFEDITNSVEFIDAPENEWAHSPQKFGNVKRAPEENYYKKKIVWKNASDGKTLCAYVRARVPGTHIMDWLSPEAMKKFMSLTYDKMADAFDNKKVWGDVVKSTFFDDLSYFFPLNCSTWSISVPQRFRDKFGAGPEKFYPYLFSENDFDSPEAGAARIMIFSTRDEIFSEVFPGISQAWCTPRGMTAAGHPSETYALEPLQFNGDPILFYKHSDAILMDSIHRKDYAVKGTKIPASAAVNFDKDTVYCETYGNFQPAEENDALMLYRAAIDVYTRGVTSMIAHGTWLDSTKVAIVPEISWRNPKMAEELPAYNLWVARVQSILQGSRNAADIAIFYPIRTLQAHYKFKIKNIVPMPPNLVELPYADYFKLGSIITDELKSAFHFIHPETFNKKISIILPPNLAKPFLISEEKKTAELRLEGNLHWQNFTTLILPKCEYMNLEEMEKILAFHNAGGLIIATGMLPSKSATIGVDNSKIAEISKKIFNGKGVFIENPDAQNLMEALKKHGKLPEYFSQNATLREDIACIHRQKDGRDFYFIGNASKEKGSVKMKILSFRNSETDKRPEWQIWNPHTGDISPAQAQYEKINNLEYAVFDIHLEAGRSIFISKPIEQSKKNAQ